MGNYYSVASPAVTSVPARTGKLRPKSSSFPSAASDSLKEDQWKSLAPHFQFPESEAYKSNLYQWNYDSLGSPLCFFQPTTEADISLFLHYYTSTPALSIFSISIAGGRHSNTATMTDSIVIDMQKFKKVDIDKEKRVGVFGAGLKLFEFDEACKQSGLVTTGGTNPDTGIAGLITGGGFGYLGKLFGTSCDNLIGVRAVLPSGDVVTATDDNEYKDLLWGHRGGGGNFGVVTEFHMRLYPHPNQVLGGACVYLLREAGLFTIGHRAILQQWKTVAQGMPREMLCMAIFPAGGPLVLSYAYVGNDLKQGHQLVSQAKKVGNPLITPFKIKPYSGSNDSLQWTALSHQQPGNYYEGAVILKDFADGTIDALLKYSSATIAPTKTCQIVLAQVGGKSGEYSLEYSPFPARHAQFWVLLLAKWENTKTMEEYEKQRSACKKWVKDLHRELIPWALEGTYNILASGDAERIEQKQKAALEKGKENGKRKETEKEKEEEEVATGVRSEKKELESSDGGVCADAYDLNGEQPDYFGEAKKRLILVKRKYDPKNLFRNNKNINPNENINDFEPTK